MSSSRARSSCNLGIQGCESQLCAGRDFNLFPSFLHRFLLLVHVHVYLYVYIYIYVCVCARVLYACTGISPSKKWRSPWSADFRHTR